MRNVQIENKGGRLVITIDVSDTAMKAAPPSRTGKTRLIATTAGAVAVPGSDGLKLGLNLMTAA